MVEPSCPKCSGPLTTVALLSSDRVISICARCNPQPSFEQDVLTELKAIRALLERSGAPIATNSTNVYDPAAGLIKEAPDVPRNWHGAPMRFDALGFPISSQEASPGDAP